MAGTVHVFDFLASEQPPKEVCVLFGDEPFLKRLAAKKIRQSLLGDAEETPYTNIEGSAAEWKDIVDELSTVALFGGSSRLVHVDGADPFVKKFRQRLEDYVSKPRKTGVLVLDVELWPKNTRLYKRLTKSGLQVECRAPEKSAGSRRVPDHQRLRSWLIDWAHRGHQVQLQQTAAEELLQLVGPEFGILDQELAKLVLFADEKRRITPELVREVVGGWRSKTIWDLMDAAADGHAAEAMRQLGQLLSSGEHPVALFGQIAWSLRRFAAATRIYEYREQSGGKGKLSSALVEAGFPHWNHRALANAERQLKQLGRDRAGRLYRRLLDADLALKGTHSAPHRARFVLEKLIMQMAQRSGR